MGCIPRSHDRDVGLSLSVALNVLLASIVDPHTARNGAATVTRGWLAALQEGPLRAAVDCVAVPALSPSRHRVVQATSVARALTSSLPAKAAFTARPAVREAVAAALRARRYDLVLLNGCDLLWLDDVLPRTQPRALIAHNVEHQLFADQVRPVARRWPLLRPLLERERRRLEAFETRGVRAVGHVAFLSERDRRWGAGIAKHTVAVPPLFPALDPGASRATARDDPGARRVGFVGGLDWWPNRDGLRWLLHEVWPQVGDAKVELHLFGTGTERAARGVSRVVGHGAIPDVAVALGSCDAFVSPCASGGGVSVKLAEVVHHGIPAITTSFAAEGLGLDETDDLAIADDADAWVAWLRARCDARRQSPGTPASQRFALATHAATIVRFVERAASG